MDGEQQLVGAVFSGINPEEFTLSGQDAGEDFHDLMAR